MQISMTSYKTIRRLDDKTELKKKLPLTLKGNKKNTIFLQSTSVW